MHQDLRTLAPDEDARSRLIYFPSWEAIPAPQRPIDPEISGERISTLLCLMEDTGPGVVATCVQALMQKTISAAGLRDLTFSLTVGEERDMDAIVELLVRGGHEFLPEIEERGQASRRGGILDIWPVTETWPSRVEFFGTEIESIRTFDPTNQRSIERHNSISIPPAGELSPDSEVAAFVKTPKGRDAHTGESASSQMPLHQTADACDETPAWKLAGLQTYLPADAILYWSGTERIDEHAQIYADTVRESGASSVLLPMDELDALLAHTPGISQVRASETQTPSSIFEALGIEPVRGVFTLPRDVMQPDAMEEMRKRFVTDLSHRAARGQQVIIFFDTDGAREHFEETHPGEDSSPETENLTPDTSRDTRVGVISEGFICEPLRLVIVAESDLLGHRKTSGRRYDPHPGRARPARDLGPRVANLEDIEPGDPVVHIEYGVGRYLGMREIVFSGRRQEVLTLEYANGTKLHVPVSQSHLLSRYIGISKRQAKLSPIGGKRWTAARVDAERAIADLAAQLLETQAARALLPGHAFPADGNWQREFNASFPYRETADQSKAIGDVKRDMQSTRPMDRLLCGDAGYGKTEVAMRAAFRTVMGEKQVAVLVPTTVLAQQHFETFRDRMADYPVRVEMLSRFISKGQQAVIKRDLAAGGVDIVIGTHTLLQPGIEFKDLGLVVIDEEQRFGVVDKERFKELRRLVDVLTLTATPIPRTLHMSLTGARDMSLLQTPPMERMAIETIVTRNTDEVIRRAILREINREGQVFYLHNRVMSIDLVRHRLARTVPEARIEVGHGQMRTSELADVMHRFVRGEFEVLLCTTIIESGMDIPRANTILIDRADRFGIADLYQLRGRVGRSSHKAYAYLLLPPEGMVDSDARERIGAVKKYSNLSAGFNLALRDLELRGAGNLLGTEQSGHIAAIGFGLYCQLLQRTVAQLKGEPVPPVIDVEVKLDFLDLSPSSATLDAGAMIPYQYIDDEPTRIGIYRKLAEVSSSEVAAGLEQELRDRFGPPPRPVWRLLRVAELRVLCHERGIGRIEVRDSKAMMRRDGKPIQEGGRFPRLKGASADELLPELLDLVRSVEPVD